jgi:Fe-S cluster biogenesis protein NfuA
MTTDTELAQCIARIDSIIEQAESADPAVRSQFQEIVQCLLEYHGAGIGRLLGLVQRANGNSQDLARAIAQDELVSSLLVLHDLHPSDLKTRVADGLAQVRPFLESHGGNVELLEIVDGVVKVRLEGNCHGCPSSAATLKSRIEEAIYAAAPDVVRIEAAEAESAPPSTVAGFVSLEQLSAR